MKIIYRIYLIGIILLLLLGIKVYSKYRYTHILKAYKLTIDNSYKDIEKITSSDEINDKLSEEPTTVQITTNKNKESIKTNEIENTEFEDNFVIQILR